jgi:hypothetical protein
VSRRSVIVSLHDSADATARGGLRANPGQLAGTGTIRIG